MNETHFCEILNYSVSYKISCYPAFHLKEVSKYLGSNHPKSKNTQYFEKIRDSKLFVLGIKIKVSFAKIQIYFKVFEHLIYMGPTA